MLIKYLNKGRGDAQEAADYLMGDYDWSGEKRKEVYVLYGSPKPCRQSGKFTDQPDCLHKWRSQCLGP